MKVHTRSAIKIVWFGSVSLLFRCHFDSPFSKQARLTAQVGFLEYQASLKILHTRPSQVATPTINWSLVSDKARTCN